ncbi:MAG: TIGR00730 family Rossman fold protein [Polaromonas sp.]|nr:TIGR00730 family Rossman fold protein [Polaromonas sp.]
MNHATKPATPTATSAPAFSLCVYCGSRPGMNPCFAQVAQEVGQWIGQHGGQLVYGGGNTGLMGEVARATLAAGGRVVGIMPKALVEREFANRDCTELHVVDNMHQRKAMMAERADAFLAMPGGIGTFEELFEVWTWHQLGYHTKPVGLLNVEGYYDGLLAFLAHTVREQLVGTWQMDLLTVGNQAPELLPRLVQSAGFGQSEQLSRHM